jgi:hypothetical protein
MNTKQQPKRANASQNRKQRWFLSEDLDGCHIYPKTDNPDDYDFGRLKPLAKISDSTEAFELIAYLNKLPAFRAGPKKRVNYAIELQRIHEYQSNLDAVRSGSYIEGINP